MSKIMVYFYATNGQMNQFEIGYMINPPLHINMVFREKFEKCLRDTYHENTMETIRNVIKNKDTCVIALMIFYESKGNKPKKCIGC